MTEIRYVMQGRAYIIQYRNSDKEDWREPKLVNSDTGLPYEEKKQEPKPTLINRLKGLF